MMKKVGVIGGLGPEATCDFMHKVIKNTPATCDQDHIPMIIYNYPQVPERMASIRGTGENAGDVLVDIAKKLEAWGADVLVMPCNTAHYYENHIVEQVHIPFISMIDEAVRCLVELGATRVVILATEGTLESGIYEKALHARHLSGMVPDANIQKEVNALIKQIKLNEPIKDEKREKILGYLKEQGAEYVLLGCTELPLAFKGVKSDFKWIDPTECLAKKVVTYILEANNK